MVVSCALFVFGCLLFGVCRGLYIVCFCCCCVVSGVCSCCCAVIAVMLPVAVVRCLSVVAHFVLLVNCFDCIVVC